MAIVFLDLEFTDLGSEPGIISVGLIDDTGAHEFYAEISGATEKHKVSAFVRQAVLPLLSGDASVRMRMRELSRRLGAWLTEFHEPVQLATDAPDWDWPLLQRVFAWPETWPENVSQTPLTLAYDGPPRKQFEHAREQAYAGGLRRHHALDDAKANRLGWLTVQANAGAAMCARHKRVDHPSGG